AFFRSWAAVQRRKPRFDRLCEQTLDLAATREISEVVRMSRGSPAREVVLLGHLWGLYQGARGARIDGWDQHFLRAVKEKGPTSGEERQAAPEVGRLVAGRAAEMLPLFDLTYCCPQCGWAGPAQEWGEVNAALAGEPGYWLPDDLDDDEEEVPSRQEA